MHGGKGASSLGPIMELVRRCRMEVWEGRERERARTEGGLLGELVRDLEAKRDAEVRRLEQEAAGEATVEEARKEYEDKIESLRGVFHRAGEVPRRRVPDWAIDDITFAVMSDPVVVSLLLLLLLPIPHPSSLARFPSPSRLGSSRLTNAQRQRQDNPMTAPQS